MLWSECFFYLYVLREWQSAHMYTWYLRVSQQPHSLLGVTHFPCSASFRFPRGPSRIQKTCGLCTLHISAAIVWEGPGLLSQQRTTHHFLLSSLLLGLITESKHSGSMILLVSQGRWFIQFSPQHCAVARSSSVELKKKKWEIGDSAEAQLVLIRCLCWEVYLGNKVIQYMIFTDDLCNMYGIFSSTAHSLQSLISADFWRFGGGILVLF